MRDIDKELIEGFLMTGCSWCKRDISNRCSFVFSKVDFEPSLLDEIESNEIVEGWLQYDPNKTPARVLLSNHNSVFKRKGWDSMLATCNRKDRSCANKIMEAIEAGGKLRKPKFFFKPEFHDN